MKGGSRSSSDAGGSIRRTGAGRGTETLLADQLETLEEQGDEFARRIETEKESVRELETKLKVGGVACRTGARGPARGVGETAETDTTRPQRAQERRFEVQREMGGENMPTESVKEQERTTRRLEDRLEKLTVRLNKSVRLAHPRPHRPTPVRRVTLCWPVGWDLRRQVTSNDALRREIDDLRRDRMQRAGVKEKLVRGRISWRGISHCLRPRPLRVPPGARAVVQEGGAPRGDRRVPARLRRAGRATGEDRGAAGANGARGAGA